MILGGSVWFGGSAEVTGCSTWSEGYEGLSSPGSSGWEVSAGISGPTSGNSGCSEGSGEISPCSGLADSELPGGLVSGGSNCSGGSVGSVGFSSCPESPGSGANVSTGGSMGRAESSPPSVGGSVAVGGSKSGSGITVGSADSGSSKHSLPSQGLRVGCGCSGLGSIGSWLSGGMISVVPDGCTGSGSRVSGGGSIDCSGVSSTGSDGRIGSLSGGAVGSSEGWLGFGLKVWVLVRVRV